MFLTELALYIICELTRWEDYTYGSKTKKENAAVAETKETAKKATVKKTREVYLQWYGKEVQLNSITARIEEMWKKEMKRKISELVDLKVYVKPEEGKAHYVINGEITGSIEL